MALPLANVKARSGLQLEIDTRWLDGNGYRPVLLRISPLRGGKAPADRRVEVSIAPTGWGQPSQRVTASATVELSQGSLYGETVVPVPASGVWRVVAVETREGGRRLRDLSHKRLNLSPRQYYQWNESAPSVLIVDRDILAFRPVGTAARVTAAGSSGVVPDFRVLASLMPVNYWNGNNTNGLLDPTDPASDSQLLQLMTDLPQFGISPPQSLPTDWIALTSVDIMVVSWPDLQAWVRDYPQQWAAARAWLATGTTLCVYGVGEDYDSLAALETLLDLPELGEGDFRGWRQPDSSLYGRKALDTGTTGVPIARQPNKLAASAPQVPPFVLRPVERGHLVAFSADDPFPGDRHLWNWMLNSIGSTHWMWYRRHGVSLQTENAEYWHLLIPGVGQAPVNSFLVLITLFVVVIGPINYFWLRRRKRLYLLLVTVPAGAVLVTIGLLLYAVLTDGVGVRARVRSITNIDQRTDRTVSWSRQTYYAGLTPSSGLTFPRQAAVIPVDFRPHSLASTSQSRRLRWRDDQRLSGGYFPARVATQFLIIESRPSAESLEFAALTDTGRLPVTNQLGVDIEQIVVCVEGAEYFGGGELAAGEMRALEKIDLGKAATEWNVLLADHRPKAPQGFDPYQIENASTFFGFNGSMFNQPAVKPTFASSVPESRLRTTVVGNLSGLKPREYIALVPVGPGLSVGTAARQQSGFHVVLGSW